MLTYLGVRNLGLLKEAVVEPDAGFTVITGETGTGKTLLVGALRLLMGDSPTGSMVGPFGDESRVDGLFSDGEEEIGVTRRVPASGRTQAFIDGNIVSRTVLLDRVGSRVEIAGQHDHVSLMRPSAVLHLIDTVVRRESPKEMAGYGEAWASYRELVGARDALGGDLTMLSRELDLCEHQIREIDAVGLVDTDDESVEALSSRLRNHDAISEHSAASIDHLEQLSLSSGDLVASVRRLASIDHALDEATVAAEGIAADVTELRRVIEDFRERSAEEHQGHQDLESWLNAIGDLRRKYGRTIVEIRQHAAEVAMRAEVLRGSLERATTIDQELDEARVLLAEAGAGLTVVRRAAGKAVVDDALAHLAGLALGEASLSLEWSAVEPGPGGMDQVRLLFSSDRRLAPGEIGQVASGGELSRLVLALRLASRDDTTPTLVFDEVDSGIGGVTALALGEKIAGLAEKGQVIAVTHLPQVAAHASRHYVVDRAGGVAVVRRVDGEERLDELTRMLAGLPESESGRETASELLAAAGG